MDRELRDRLRAHYGRDRLAAASTPVAETPAPAELARTTPDVTRAFLTEVDGKSIITAPATVDVLEQARTPNDYYLWLRGRFVGAEEANRNGALWQTADLQMGQPTVKHGPLNWLHDSRHVIGTIAESQLVTPGEQAGSWTSNAPTFTPPPTVPYIEAASVLWRWIYPDEAKVVTQAAEANQLWYSMECISKEVACVGDSGCGTRVPYIDTILKAPSVCEHIRERSGTRHFIDPTFLGGAVIVPPVRPGWADANLELMREASQQAEAASQQAGHPYADAVAWEILMAQVLAYARG